MIDENTWSHFDLFVFVKVVWILSTIFQWPQREQSKERQSRCSCFLKQRLVWSVWMNSVACFTGPTLDSSFVLNDVAAPSGMDDVTQDTGIRDERARQEPFCSHGLSSQTLSDTTEERHVQTRKPIARYRAHVSAGPKHLQREHIHFKSCGYKEFKQWLFFSIQKTISH